MARARDKYLELLGIPVYRLRTHEQTESAPTETRGSGPPGRDPAPEQRPPDAPEQLLEGDAQVAGMDWDTLQRTVSVCEKCELHKSRNRAVFGVGDRNARWLVIGEAPGADEDRKGEPFVGRAGRLLDAMLEAAGVSREQVFITNILKCRPPNNRDPKPDEAAACRGYLKRQIALIQPELIIAVGRVAAQNLLETDTPIGRLRGRVYRFGEQGIPLVATYHPAYLLRSPGQKPRAWEDLKRALATAAPLQ